MNLGAYSDPSDASKRCPNCRGPLVRIPRKPLDRVLSLFSPRWRYRCRTLGCGWEGTLRVKR